MPLKLYQRPGHDIWYVRGTVRGIHCYETTGTSDRVQAETYRATREARLYEEAVFGRRATATFAEAALSYLQFETRSDRTKFVTKKLVEHFGKRLLDQIDQGAADTAVTAIVGNDAAPATKRRAIYTPLAAILNHAASRKWCDRPKFAKPAVPKGRTEFLTPDEAIRLISVAAPHLQPLLHFCLCTGARVSEALDLDWTDVDLGASRVRFRDTKNGLDRIAALPEAAVMTLANLPRRTGSVFPRDDGEPYANTNRQIGGQFRAAWLTALKRAGITRHLTPHDLRHTWASWFYAVSKDPLLLKAEGGWQSIVMVERYVHLLPSHFIPEIMRVWGRAHPRLGLLPCKNGAATITG
jgi:integrase